MKICPDSPDLETVLKKEAYCGRLGHFVPFQYCMHPAQDDPCFKILDCWWQTFEVVSFLRKNLSEEMFSAIASRTEVPNRIEGILKVLSDLDKR